MNIFMEHWLSVVVGGFLLSMVLYGHYRGFLRLAVTFSALILSLLTVKTAVPEVTGYLQEHTQIYQMLGETLLKSVGADIQAFSEPQTPAQERELIEQLGVSEQLKEMLLENNNREIYQLLRADRFLDYVGSYLAGVLLNLITGIVLFLVVYIGLRILIHWLDILARLPILHGINQIAGAVLGGIQGLLLVWLFFLAVQFCSEKVWASEVLSQISGSVWLNFLYKNNLFSMMFISVLKSFA